MAKTIDDLRYGALCRASGGRTARYVGGGKCIVRDFGSLECSVVDALPATGGESRLDAVTRDFLMYVRPQVAQLQEAA